MKMAESVLSLGLLVSYTYLSAESSTKCNTGLLNGGTGLIEFVQHGLVDGDGRVEPMDGSRAGVEQVGNGIELLLAVHGQVRALGQVLADQSVGVLAGAPLPRAVRITEVHHHTRVGCQLSVARHLLALVVGQRLAHGFGDAAQFGREALQCRGGRRIGQLDQHHQSGTALEQYTHGRAVTRPLDEIALPVAGKGPVAGFGRAHMDAQQIGHLTPAILAPAARHALGLGPTQTGDQVLAQLTLGHGVDAGVDALVGDGALGFIGPHELECARDLRGRPTPRQEVLDHTEEHGVAGQFGAFATLEASAPGTQAGGAGVVLSRRTGHCRRTIWPGRKARQFSGDGRRGSAQRQGDLPRRAVVRLHHHDRRPFFGRQLFVVLAHQGTLPGGCCT